MAGAAPGATLGIDLASQPANTAVCRIDWGDGRARVTLLARGRDAGGALDDPRLIALMTGDGAARPAKVGIDAPLGWPVAFVQALGDPDAWPLEHERPPVEFVRRLSDRLVHAETGKVPLSVSTDLIAYPAMRAQRLMRRLALATGEAIDRSGMRGRVCEVYPDVTATRFGLRLGDPPRRGYKGADGAAARERMLARLLEAADWLDLAPAQRAACVGSDDCLDALLAALATRAALLGHTAAPTAEQLATARREGWIHVPVPDALALLS